MGPSLIVLETGRLTVRRWLGTDLEAMIRVLGDPEVMRFSNGALDAGAVTDWLKLRTDGASDGSDPGPWAVVERATGLTIGYCGFFRFPVIDGRPETEIGYRFARDAWGKGYATEAALAVRDDGFAERGLARLIALIDPDNTRSIRVAEKLGMHYEKDVTLEGYTHPDRLYAVESPR